MGRNGVGGKDSKLDLLRPEEEGDRGRPEANESVAEREGQPSVQDEAGESVKVGIVVPAQDRVHTWFAYSLSLALSRFAYDHPEVKTSLYFNNGTVLSEQRTELAKIAMIENCDWVVWFDSDMRFPSDTIERLLSHKQPIVLAGYPTRKAPAIEPTVYSDDVSMTRVYTTVHSTGLQEIASGGFGCVAVHRSVFETMETPWFHIPWNEEDQKYDCGEDIWFCRQARKAGFKVMLDHDLSKEIAHIGQYEFTYREAIACRPKIEELRSQRIKIK